MARGACTGGAVAFSDSLWRHAHPAPESRAFWDREYPGMRDLPGLLALLDGAGWRVLGARWLGDAAWEAYYAPLEARIAALRPEAMRQGNAEMLAVLHDNQAEIDLWRQHGSDYGYYLTVVQPI